jgi:hypothetical protein
MQFVLAAATDWQPVEAVPLDLPPELLFETVRVVDDFEGATLNWRAERGEQQAEATARPDTSQRHSGAASLRVDYVFSGKPGLDYIQVNGQAEFTQPGLGFGFWYKSDGTPFVLRLRFTDAGGEWHQVDVLHHDRVGWQFIAGMLDSRGDAWGGDGNRRKDYPLKLAGIVIDRPRAGFKGQGSLWIDDAAVVKARPPESHPIKVETQNRRFGNVYAVGDAVALRITGPGERIRWSVGDFFGREVARGESAAEGAEARFTLDRPGWFSCKIELLKGGRPLETRSFACAALAGGAVPARSEFVGVCTHFGQGSYPLECMELMRRFGIDQFRDEISWGSYETKKGQLTMPAHASNYLKHAASLGMRPLIIFDYANRLYDNGAYPNSPESIQAFAAYAVDLARQTRGTVKMFEIWNEWVGGCGMNGRPGAHDGEAYGRLLKPVYAAVKQAFPDLTVVGIGGEYGAKCAENILGAVRTAGPEAMDAWSIHPYRYPRPPEASGLVNEVTNIAGKVAMAGVKTKAWITEIGYPTHRTSGGSDLAAQARHTIRTLALLQSTPVVERVFWYDLKDDGTTRDHNEHNFGLIHHQSFNCAPKPAMVAAGTFIRLTAGAECQQVIQTVDLFTATYRRGDGNEVLIAWTTRGDQTVAVGGQLTSLTDLMGQSLATASPVTLNENPVYLVGRNLRVNGSR